MRKRKPATQHGLEYIRDWNRTNGKRILLQFNLETDADVIEWLEEQPSKIDAVRQLIRKEIAGK